MTNPKTSPAPRPTTEISLRRVLLEARLRSLLDPMPDDELEALVESRSTYAVLSTTANAELYYRRHPR